ncbi:MAG: hypothetical protein Q9M36_03325 [Sulfurovum sp.]|nr:hypothetical protein [Sulfurovum sp.]
MLLKTFSLASQLFGFTGTPIFEENAKSISIEGEEASLKTTEDIFQQELHNYTITHAIEDGNVLRFHIDYFKPEGWDTPKQGESLSSKAIAEAILQKHDKSTADKKFNAVLATSSINHAIEYYKHFKALEHDLNIACVFSPPAEGNKDVAQLQEDLPTEREDNKQEPQKKKDALKEIIKDYNTLFGTNHDINNFDVYYQDIQTRIKDQKYPNSDLPHSQKLDIVIVVDMLLTGFDSKFLNTLYVDKNLNYHGLIQAFSRTNRVLNDTKPYGNILDFRSLQDAVDIAITRFSGESTKQPKEIWLVDPAPKTIEKFKEATKKLDDFMALHSLQNKPQEIANLKGDTARAEFINTFKEIQRLKAQLDQHTDLSTEQTELINQTMTEDTLRAFKSMYLETAKRLQKRRDKDENTPAVVQELDFEFVLFASTLVDYDYIMTLIAKYAGTQTSKKQKMSKEQLISLLKSNANLSDESDDMIEYINSLEVGKALNEEGIKKGYEDFKANKSTKELQEMAKKYELEPNRLQEFVEKVLDRYIFDGELLTDLLAPLGLGWKARRLKELALMEELSPLLRKMAKGKELSGLEAYDE